MDPLTAGTFLFVGALAVQVVEAVTHHALLVRHERQRACRWDAEVSLRRTNARVGTVRGRRKEESSGSGCG